MKNHHNVIERKDKKQELEIIRNKEQELEALEQEYNENFADKAVKIAEKQYKTIDKIYKQLSIYFSK